MKDWSSWLAEGDKPNQRTIIRRNIEKGLSCGSETCLKKLEKKAGHMLTYRPQGRLKTHGKG